MRSFGSVWMSLGEIVFAFGVLYLSYMIPWWIWVNVKEVLNRRKSV